MAYTFIKKFLFQNHPNAKLVQMRAHVIHWTANTNIGANAIGHFNYFNSTYVGASANFFIDSTTVVEAIPVTMQAWHCGGSNYTEYAKNLFSYWGLTKPNYYTVGYEMCVNADGNFEFTKENTIDFVARKMIETNCYTVIRHYDVTYKNCPNMFSPFVTNGDAEWYAFKAKILQRVSDIKMGLIK